jgi:hypothetical protein
VNIRSLFERIAVQRIEEQEPAPSGVLIRDSEQHPPHEKGTPREGEALAVERGKKLGGNGPVEEPVRRTAPNGGASRDDQVKSAAMHFVLKGFTQDTEFRVFAFDGIAADRTRTEFAVRADLALIRRYGIRVQELPLLCRGLLETRDESEETHTVTFTEEKMRVHQEDCAATRQAAAIKRNTSPKRASPSANAGAAWRGTRW